MQSSPRQFRAVVNEGFKVPVCPLMIVVTVYCACAVSVHAVVVGNLWMFAKFIHTRREIVCVADVPAVFDELAEKRPVEMTPVIDY